MAAALATYRGAAPRGRRFREGLVLMVLMATLAFAVCALAQAPPDLSRALYSYHALCDLLLIADAGWIAEALAARRGLEKMVRPARFERATFSSEGNTGANASRREATPSAMVGLIWIPESVPVLPFRHYFTDITRTVESAV